MCAYEKIGVQATIEGLPQYLNGMNQMNQATSQVATGLSTKLKVAGAAAAASIAAVGMAAVGFGLKGLHTADQMEQMKLGFETLLGSAEAAQKRIEDLAKFAAETPFTLPGISKAARLLETFGLFSMENLTMVGDAAAGVSVGIEEIAFWVGRAYTAIQSGRPFGESAMRLQELGLMSGTARNKMEEMTKEGASADEVFAALSTELGRFSGLMVKQSTTIGGLQSTLSDNFNLMLAALAMPFVSKYKAGLGFVIEQIDKNQATLVGAGAQMASAFDLAASGIGKLLAGIKPLVPSIASTVVVLGALGAAFLALKLIPIILYGIAQALAAVGIMAVNTRLALAAFASPTVIIAGLAAAFMGLDFVVRKWSGAGIISWLRGTQEDAKNAAAAVKLYGDSLAFVDTAMRSGLTAVEAHSRALEVWTQKAKDAADITKILAEQGKSAWAAAEAQSVAYKELARQILALNPTFLELSRVMAEIPGIAPYVKDEYSKLQKAAIDYAKTTDSATAATTRLHEEFGGIVKEADAAADALAGVGKSAKEVAGQITDVGDVVGELSSLILPSLKDSLEELQLKREVNEFEALKEAMGEAFPAESQRRLDEINARLSFMGKRAAEAELQIQILGARFLETFGPEAQAEFQKVLDVIKLLPEEKIIEILPYLDELGVRQILIFMDYLKRGISVPVAFVFGAAGAGAPPTVDVLLQRLHEIRTTIPDVGIDVDKLTRQFVNFGSQASSAAGSAASAAEALVDPLEALNTLFTGLASSVDVYTSALDRLLGLPTRESAQEDLEMAQLKLRALDLEAQAEEEKLAREKRIADLQDRLNQIQGKGNTLLEEKLKKQIAGEEKGKGPAEKELDTINAQLDTLQRQGEQRRLLNDIRRAEATLANQNLLTDLQVEDTVGRIIQALPGLTSQQNDIVSGALAWFGVNQNIIAQYAQMIIALGNIQQAQIIMGLPGVAAPATNVPASVAPTGPTESGWSFVNGQWTYTPGYQYGGIVPGPVGRPVMAMVHGGGRIVPPNQSWSLPISVSVQGMDWVTIKSAVHSEVDNALDRARTQSFKSGAALSSGIG